ncbi:sister chromatid cohesion protein Pds5p [Trichomonascus vanleenenianus]|uniref:sister chromatid cohesion factor PDS5 n=1 Tax=Trichomonascus vanleenenianus TaxID=2268995 RepID=UPI003ECAA00D
MDPPVQKLAFHDDLLKKKQISELMASLEALYKELSQIQQDCLDIDSLKPTAMQLKSERLIKHKDLGVRIYTARCLIEVLRHAVNVKLYTEKELTQLFWLFLNVLKDGSLDSYYQATCNLLSAMENIEVAGLMCSLRSAEKLVVGYFDGYYDIIEESKKAIGPPEIFLSAILSQIVANYEGRLPQSVIELIFSKFLYNSTPESKDKSNASLQFQLPNAYRVSKSISAENIDTLIRYTNQYFSELLDPSYLGGDGDEGESDSEESPQAKQLKRTENLIVEIWNAVPALLVNVSGQLEKNLEVDHFLLRDMATRTIGKLIALPSPDGDILQDSPSTYKKWLKRGAQDKQYSIRVTWTNAAAEALKKRHYVPKDLVATFVSRLDDTNEHVRIAACGAAGEFDLATLQNRIHPHASSPVLGTLSSRLRDKKRSVRIAAFSSVGKLYNRAYGLDEMFDWVPSAIFEQIYLNDKEVNELIDITLWNYILPEISDDNARTRRLLSANKCLSDQAARAWEALGKRQVETAKYVNMLLLTVKKFESASDPGSLKNQLNLMKQFFAKMSSKEDEMGDAIDHIIACKDKSLYRLLGACVNPESNYMTVVSSFKKVLKAMPKYKAEMEILLLRCSYLAFNKSIITPLIRISRDNEDTLNSVAHSYLREIATHAPLLLSNQADELISLISAAEPGKEVAENADTNNVDTLKTANMLFHKSKEKFPQSEHFAEKILEFCSKGTPAEAKQAVKLLHYSERKEMYCNILVGEIVKLLSEFNEASDEEIEEKFAASRMPTQLSALAQLYLVAPELTEAHSDVISEVLIRRFIMSNALASSDELYEKSWIEDEEVDDFCNCKLLSLRVFVNRLRSIVEWNDTTDRAIPVLKVLISLLGNLGELARTRDTPAGYKSRLRLEAGLKLLKLARIPVYEKLIRASDLDRMVLLLQDECLHIRQRFVTQLTRYLSGSSQKLPERYLALVFMMAYEPDNDLAKIVTTWIKARFAQQQEASSYRTSSSNDLVFEKAFSRLIYLTAHHQDVFNDDDVVEDGNRKMVEDLGQIMRYLLYYLTLIAHQNNLGLIFHIAQRVKQYRDVEEDYSTRLYIVSELAEFVVIRYRDLKSWNMDAWPGTIALPRDAFKGMASTEQAKEVARKSFISEAITPELEDHFKKLVHNTGKHHPRPHGTGTAGSGAKKVESGDESEAEPPRKKVTKRTRKKSNASSTKRAKSEEAPRRQSSRLQRNKVNYGEESDEDDEGKNDQSEEESDYE